MTKPSGTKLQINNASELLPGDKLVADGIAIVFADRKNLADSVTFDYTVMIDNEFFSSGKTTCKHETSTTELVDSILNRVEAQIMAETSSLRMRIN